MKSVVIISPKVTQIKGLGTFILNLDILCKLAHLHIAHLHKLGIFWCIFSIFCSLHNFVFIAISISLHYSSPFTTSLEA